MFEFLERNCFQDLGSISAKINDAVEYYLQSYTYTIFHYTSMA